MCKHCKEKEQRMKNIDKIIFSIRDMIEEFPLKTWSLKSVNDKVHDQKIIITLSIKDHDEDDDKSYQEEFFTITVEKKETYKKERVEQ
tara:strand:- start:115 stop:378 length:264 start_codon:yes stop_codon:yes gene_type:complete